MSTDPQTGKWKAEDRRRRGRRRWRPEDRAPVINLDDPKQTGKRDWLTQYQGQLNPSEKARDQG